MSELIVKVFVDADSCPVKKEIVSICQKFNQSAVFVSSIAHEMNVPDGFTHVSVDSDKEAADMYILNQSKRGDCCVTQDHALASILLPKGVDVLSPRGYVYREETIMQMLDARYLSQKERRKGGKTKGPRAFTEEDRSLFCHQFTRVLSKKAGK
ncbi:YaiI/YqxD family protein [Alkalihalophilus marmarensis]|jgi:uncharacterized protein YaiI (UPF0178 family)|uniref:UPF0178 protein A33I_05310 n=1 Tax=Alkalihalophilus marmarensis DSM 21297 TaxID=1188261 RepID=U6ST04_9BACI|nr:DUF188 domain-containing protein [Alkalihalophilus marmarensis]ERN54768.1 hypothetical protein A33I_05310 [Alkalihalophilus marmarensis DSM 21297]MCM3488611.1 DUF188 domain-containing protein [Alkalihalophilus marmarensis]MEC2070483.1 DUF188 domain-containing protein [Alkalihalophilus marmarensis]